MKNYLLCLYFIIQLCPIASFIFVSGGFNGSITQKNPDDLFWLEGLREEEIDISHRTDSLSMLILTTLLIITVLSAWLFKLKKFGWLHETGFSLILGVIVGGLIRLSLNLLADEQGYSDTVTVHLLNANKLSVAPGKMVMNISGQQYLYYLAGVVMNNSGDTKFYPEDIEQIEAKSSFNPEIFFYVLLPPIVFYAGYQLQRFYFFSNIGSILLLAFIGTGINFVATGGMVYGYMVFKNQHETFTFTESMLFSAIISATDPVTVLAIFGEIRIDHNLYALVFGESVLNDAIAIGLHKSVLTYMKYPQTKPVTFNVWSFFEAALNFSSILFGSFFIGTLTAFITALITKLTKIGMFPLLETALILLMSYSTFLISEVINWSGIVAVLFCGISQKHYTYHNLSFATSIRVVQIFELINFLSESFIFAYIGLSVFLSVEHKWDVQFIIFVFITIQISRAISIYSLCLLLNLSRDPPIPCVYMHMLTWAGLRGAMAFALAIRNTATEIRRLMLTATLSSVILSVIIQGGLTLPLVRLLKIKSHEIEEIGSNAGLNNALMLLKCEPMTKDDDEKSFYDDLSKNTYLPPKRNRIIEFFHRMDQNYLMPFLTNKHSI